MADACDPNPGFLRNPRRESLLGRNPKKVPMAIAFGNYEGLIEFTEKQPGENAMELLK